MLDALPGRSVRSWSNPNTDHQDKNTDQSPTRTDQVQRKKATVPWLVLVENLNSHGKQTPLKTVSKEHGKTLNLPTPTQHKTNKEINKQTGPGSHGCELTLHYRLPCSWGCAHGCELTLHYHLSCSWGCVSGNAANEALWAYQSEWAIVAMRVFGSCARLSCLQALFSKGLCRDGQSQKLLSIGRKTVNLYKYTSIFRELLGVHYFALSRTNSGHAWNPNSAAWGTQVQGRSHLRGKYISLERPNKAHVD